MKPVSVRLAGLLIVFAALLGTLAGIAGIVVIWQAEPAIRDGMVDTIDLFDTSLETTSSMLMLVNGSMFEMRDQFSVIKLSLEDASSTMSSTAEVTDSVADLIGVEFGNVVAETQRSLISVQNSARMIDNTLGIIAGIPLIGPSISGGYRRDMPLELSILEVSTSLESVPGSLVEVETGMRQTARNFEQLQGDLDELIVTIDSIETRLEGAESLMGEYQEIVDRSQARLARVRSNVEGIVDVMVWGAIAFLVWFLIAQLSLYVQGFEMLRRDTVVVTHMPQLREPDVE